MRSDPFWQRPVDDWLSALAASPDGLDEEAAARRLAADGPNRVAPPAARRILARIAHRLAEPLVAILLVAAAVAGLSGDTASFAIIVVIVTISVALDVTQEHRAELAAEALRRSVAVRARARRSGRSVSINVEDVVAGDVVDLRGGDLVPADGIVLESRGAHVNEALLTGEPYPVEKRRGPSGAQTVSDAYDALFGGTAMVSGEATLLIVATGDRTRFGAIAAALGAAEPPTAFERGVRHLGVLILRLTAFLVMFVLLAHLVFARPVLESFLFAVALAVGLTPELLPMVMTVTLSRGAMRMAARKVMVKRLSAIHDLGAMDVLCTDKTGTLTEARIALVGNPGVGGDDDPDVLSLAALNARFESGIRSPLDDAILAQAGGAEPGWSKIAEAPFDFDRRRVSVLVEHEGRRILVVKGAPEAVLPCCTQAGIPGVAAVPLDDALRQRIAADEQQRAGQGLRMLAVAWKEMPAEARSCAPSDEAGLLYAGSCVFVDPPKASAGEAALRLGRAGIRVKVVSGDAAPVVRHLVDTLGIPARGLLTGTEMEQLGDEALASRIDETDLFVRVSPDQKTRIVRALQARGHTVGFMGDGINDAPAIRAADAGLSVDGATDVARAAADLILLAPDLGVLADGVEEGRRTYANITKYIRMGTSSNFGNMLSMALASLAIPFLPLTPVQILLNNLIYDVSETGIPFDSVDQADLASPHAWDMADVLRFTLVMGPLSSLFDIATFALLRLVFAAPPETFRTAWFLESMATQILVIFLIRTAGPAWASRPHPVLVATSLGALAAALALGLGPLAPLLGFGPVAGALAASLAGLVLAYLACAEIAKRWAISPPRLPDRHGHAAPSWRKAIASLLARGKRNARKAI